MPCFVTSTDLRLVNKVHFSAALVAYKHSGFRVHLNSLRWAFQSYCEYKRCPGATTCRSQTEQKAASRDALLIAPEPCRCP